MIRKRVGRRTGNGENPGLDISSLIDVSFLLLIYFLITSTLEPKEGDIGMTVPTDRLNEAPREYDFDRPEIEVDALGIVTFSGEIVGANPEVRELVQLTDRLETYLKAANVYSSKAKAGVNLSVDDSVKGQRFMDVMNCLAGVGITDVAIDGMKTEQE